MKSLITTGFLGVHITDHGQLWSEGYGSGFINKGLLVRILDQAGLAEVPLGKVPYHNLHAAHCLTVWYWSCNVPNQKSLQRVVRTMQ